MDKAERQERLRILQEEEKELKDMAEDIPAQYEETVPSLMRIIRENQRKQEALRQAKEMAEL